MSEPASDNSQDVPKAVSNLSTSFRDRAKHLRANATRILILIVAVLLTGITVFVAAGSIANRETTSAVDESRKAMLDSLKRERDSLESEQKRTTALYEETRMTLVAEAHGTGPSGRIGRGPITQILEQEIASLLDRGATLQKQIAEVDAPRGTLRFKILAVEVAA